jgi:hypothetical protein
MSVSGEIPVLGTRSVTGDPQTNAERRNSVGCCSQNSAFVCTRQRRRRNSKAAPGRRHDRHEASDPATGPIQPPAERSSTPSIGRSMIYWVPVLSVVFPLSTSQSVVQRLRRC